MVKYVGEGCKCIKCKKKHFCPDGCGEHFKKDKCKCTWCFLAEVRELK